MLSGRAQPPRFRLVVTSRILGDGLVQRVRRTYFGLLAITAAFALALIGMVVNQGWPLVPGSPIPGFPIKHESVHDAVIVATAKSGGGAGGTQGSSARAGADTHGAGAGPTAGSAGGQPRHKSTVSTPTPSGHGGVRAPASKTPAPKHPAQAPAAAPPTPPSSTPPSSTPTRSTPPSEPPAAKPATVFTSEAGDHSSGGGSGKGEGNGKGSSMAPSHKQSSSAVKSTPTAATPSTKPVPKPSTKPVPKKKASVAPVTAKASAPSQSNSEKAGKSQLSNGKGNGFAYGRDRGEGGN